MNHPDDKCCSVQMKNGFAHLFIPMWHKYTLDSNEEGKKFIPDMDKFMDWVIIKNGWAKNARAAKNLKRIHHTIKDVPPERAFVTARRFNANEDGIEIDMSEARKIKTELIRKDRDDRFADLDIEYMRADEDGDTEKKTEIAFKKQILRDIPETIQVDLNAISDPATLESWQPAWPE